VIARHSGDLFRVAQITAFEKSWGILSFAQLRSRSPEWRAFYLHRSQKKTPAEQGRSDMKILFIADSHTDNEQYQNDPEN